jgi:hypothetical protein
MVTNGTNAFLSAGASVLIRVFLEEKKDFLPFLRNKNIGWRN